MNDLSDFACRVPAHVPPDRAWDHDFDLFAADGDDPFLAAARLHDEALPDIVYARGAYRGNPGWLLTRFAQVQDAFFDHAVFSRAENSDFGALLGVDWRLNPLEIDPPLHGKYRAVLQPFFQPRAIARLEAKVRAICRELLDPLAGKGGCEFIADFASLFPSYIFLELMGLPREDLPRFMAWEGDYMRGATLAIRARAGRDIAAYLEDYVESRRAYPGDDLGSAIVNARIDGRPLDQGEVMGMCMVLYTGGLDTVLSSLGWYMRELATNLPLQLRLRDNPQDIPGAVDELLRAFGPVLVMRTVKSDVDFHGVSMKAGDWVSLPTQLASRDPRAYADPHRVDPDRKARHMTLATGVHNCLGIHLAKREIRVVLEEWLSRFSEIRVPEGARIRFHTRGVWGVDALPLQWIEH
jgi:cytochrome P450